MVRVNGSLYVIFFKGISQGFSWYKFFVDLFKLCLIPGARLEHCAAYLDCDDGFGAVYHTCKNSKSSWKCSKAFFSKFEPDACVFVGRYEFDCGDLHNNIKSIRFNFVSILFWYVVTRWFSKWKPSSNCTMQTVKILRYFGVEVNNHVVPVTLYKELKENAHDSHCWSSWGWKDNLSRTDRRESI
jgi:hypothetical protein